MNFRFFPTLLVGAMLLALPGCNQKEIAALQQQNAELTKTRDQLTLEKTALAADKARNEEALRGSLLSKNQQVNQLNQNLGEAETDIRNKNADLQSKEADLQSKNARIADLQNALAQKDAATKALRQRVSDALLGFNAQDLQVSVKNGKVYVSLSEQLLFKSGSTKVDPKGQDALRKLAVVLKDNKDVNVLVEGHTDNVPIKGATASGARDNWDLSVMRATEITRLLTTAGMDPAQVTPSGRAEFLPLAPNDTPANKALNRRTDIILTPKLDELFSILGQN
ncbi:OmpA family protein [Hymenobacter sp. DH14]|uniref:OmpA family protein n=1 Tax=Hymenobacter cyanobacteriorum TaxID=2926463 RepID=A0A9X2AF28_9BACT|nr:OmpA family protein [Hymenobacter cyanobacteriorum]MCI1187417.1 OmpA family protein [Hymenobacter cyanobacteriorum]